jgi:hypothetical protein
LLPLKLFDPGQSYPDVENAVKSYWMPSGYVKIAIENGPFVVDFPIKDGDLP